MSLDEDSLSGPSLRDLVVESLKSNGVLGKIQAELKASVYLTLEEDIQERSIPLVDKKATELLASPAGKLSLSIVRDFITCLGLEFTSSVFESEASISPVEDLPKRNALIEKFNLEDVRDETIPVLFHMLNHFQNSSEKSSTESSQISERRHVDPVPNGQELKATEELLINLNISNESSHENSVQKSSSNAEGNNENSSSEQRQTANSQRDTDDQPSNPSLESHNAYEDDFASNTETDQKEAENVKVTENVDEIIEEDISINDGISSLSEMTDSTKDFTASEKTDICDYQEML